MKLTGLKVASGETAPWWYGVAYYEAHSDYVVAYPIPVNLIVRWARDVWWLLRTGKRDALRTAYDQGFHDAWQKAYQYGKKAGREDLRSELRNGLRESGLKI